MNILTKIQNYLNQCNIDFDIYNNNIDFTYNDKLYNIHTQYNNSIVSNVNQFNTPKLYHNQIDVLNEISDMLLDFIN